MPFTSFGETREKQAYESTFKKTLFLDMSTTSTVRILTPNKFELYTHYLNHITAQCLGEGCPICANNKALIMQFPDTFKEEPKYSPRRTVCLANVLDKTLVRECPKCHTEYHSAKGQPPVTCKCGEILAGEPAPSMKIKVLSRGVTLFDQLDAINNAILDESGEKIGVTGYDVTFIISGTGKNKVITPITGQTSAMPLYDEKDLYDLETVTLKFTPSEMVDIQRGVSLKDIFAAKRATEKLGAIVNADVAPELLESTQADVDLLFNQI
jgi:hypothetical protein